MPARATLPIYLHAAAHIEELAKSNLATVFSFDAPIRSKKSDQILSELALGDTMVSPGPTPEEELIEREQSKIRVRVAREKLVSMFSQLNSRERTTLLERAHGKSYADIGRLLGISREGVRLIEARVRRKLDLPGPREVVDTLAERACKFCGVLFQPTDKAQRYCTAACSAEALALGLPPMECGECGTTFTPPLPTSKFCSYACQRKNSRRRLAARALAGRTPPAPRACLVCGTTFVTHNTIKKFCGKECRDTDRARRERERNK